MSEMPKEYARLEDALEDLIQKHNNLFVRIPAMIMAEQNGLYRTAGGNKGELIPLLEKMVLAKGFRYFDNLPSACYYWASVKAYPILAQLGQLGDSTGGLTEFRTKTMLVDKKFGEDSTVITLLHELGHALDEKAMKAGSMNVDNLSRTDIIALNEQFEKDVPGYEAVAYAVGYVVGSKVGLTNILNSTIAGLTTYGIDEKLLRDNFSKIISISEEIVNWLASPIAATN